MFNMFKTKEKTQMSETESYTVKNLKKKITDQAGSIETMKTRLNRLSDDIVVLQSQIDKFKTEVATDMKYVIEKIRTS